LRAPREEQHPTEMCPTAWKENELRTKGEPCRYGKNAGKRTDSNNLIQEGDDGKRTRARSLGNKKWGRGEEVDEEEISTSISFCERRDRGRATNTTTSRLSLHSDGPREKEMLKGNEL